MIPAVEFEIRTTDNTIRGNMDFYTPSKEDSRVLDREYKLYVFDGETEMETGGIKGSIKCHDMKDVITICNNLISLAKSNDSRIAKRSFIGIHYCRQVEDDKPVESCTLEKLWSK